MSGLDIWVVYDHPSDLPDAYVARRFRGNVPTQSVMWGNDLEMLRVMLAIDMGLTRIVRDPEDDPVILETWV